MSGLRGPLLPLGLSAYIPPVTYGFGSALFLLGLRSTPGTTPPIVEIETHGGDDPWADDDEEIMSVIMAYMGMRNV